MHWFAGVQIRCIVFEWWLYTPTT